MNLKLFGAVMILAACGWGGFSVSVAHRRSESVLRELIQALEFMCSELQYKMTPLPDLCLLAAGQAQGAIAGVLEALSQELNAQVSADAASCMEAVLETAELPEVAIRNLRLLAKSLGRFDLQGQISGLQSVIELSQRDLEGLVNNRDVRLRSYQTLGLCAGAALVILFI